MMEKQNRGKAKTKADGKGIKTTKTNRLPFGISFPQEAGFKELDTRILPIQKLIQGWIT